MKVNCVGVGTALTPKQTNFRSQNPRNASQTEHDEFVSKKKSQKNRMIRLVASLSVVCAGLLLLKLTKKPPKDILTIPEFENINQAKRYFEKLGIETDFRGAKEEHLSLLNKIKDNLKQLQEMGVKKDKPDSITISDWRNAPEYEELCRKKGINVERREDYWAFCSGAESGKNHIFINSNHPEFEKFLHEMGHANHFTGIDSLWHSKGLTGHAFADKQLEVLNCADRIYKDRHDSKLSNIFYQRDAHSHSKYIFPSAEGEVRYVHLQGIVDKMYSETNCYDGGKSLTEQVADVFEGLMKGKKFSDETMLYYDFAGGARIPNLKINDKKYDEYIESLYNNQELIQKLRENVKITKI